MKFWCSNDEDAYSYFGVENKFLKGRCKDESFKMNVFNINGSMVLSMQDQEEFIKNCNMKLVKIFSQSELFNKYKLYLFANVELMNPNSRVERYKKVWKVLKKTDQIEELILGPEVEMKLDESLFFSSIAQFSLDNLTNVLELISKGWKRCTIFASNKENILSHETIASLFSFAFNKNSKFHYEIDYINLMSNICPHEYILFRWGDSSEEIGVDLIYDSKMSNLFL